MAGTGFEPATSGTWALLAYLLATAVKISSDFLLDSEPVYMAEPAMPVYTAGPARTIVREPSEMRPNDEPHGHISPFGQNCSGWLDRAGATISGAGPAAGALLSLPVGFGAVGEATGAGSITRCSIVGASAVGAAGSITAVLPAGGVVTGEPDTSAP